MPKSRRCAKVKGDPAEWKLVGLGDWPIAAAWSFYWGHSRAPELNVICLTINLQLGRKGVSRGGKTVFTWMSRRLQVFHVRRSWWMESSQLHLMACNVWFWWDWVHKGTKSTDWGHWKEDGAKKLKMSSLSGECQLCHFSHRVNCLLWNVEAVFLADMSGPGN